MVDNFCFKEVLSELDGYPVHSVLRALSIGCIKKFVFYISLEKVHVHILTTNQSFFVFDFKKTQTRLNTKKTVLYTRLADLSC